MHRHWVQTGFVGCAHAHVNSSGAHASSRVDLCFSGPTSDVISPATMRHCPDNGGGDGTHPPTYGRAYAYRFELTVLVRVSFFDSMAHHLPHVSRHYSVLMYFKCQSIAEANVCTDSAQTASLAHQGPARYAPNTCTPMQRCDLPRRPVRSSWLTLTPASRPRAPPIS